MTAAYLVYHTVLFFSLLATVALFEFSSDAGHRSLGNPTAKLSRFEMNRSEISEMLTVLEGIQKTIDEVSY